MSLQYVSSDTLDFNPDDLVKHFYRFDMEWIDEDSNSYQITPRSIVGFNISCDYKNNIMPIYNLITVLSANRYNILQTNKSDLDIKIKLSHFTVPMRYGQQDLGEYFSDYGYENTTDDFETLFQPYVDHLAPLTNQEMLTIKDDTGRDDDPLNDEDNIDAINCEFSLFNRTSMNIMKAINNIILQDVNVLDTLGVILTKSGVTKLMINKPDNTKTYDQVIIPPDSLVNTIDYIQRVYGIYNTGVRKFIDWDDVFYLLSNSNSSIPVKKNQYPLVEIFVTEASDSRGYNEGSITDDSSQMYRIITSDKPAGNLSKASASKEIIGNKLVFSNPKSKKYGTSYDDAGNFTFGSGVNVVAPDLSSDIDGDDRIKFYYNDEDNAIREYETQYALEEVNQLLMFTFEDVDINIFTMNRKFKITFEDPQYEEINGIYKLEKCDFNFIRTTSDIYMKCTVTATFNIWPTFEISNTRDE